MAAGAGLLAVGLWIGGATGRVHALVRAASASPSLKPIPGSQSALPRQVVLDGQPARLRRCVAPNGWSVARVRDHFEEVADAESRFQSGERVPYLAVDGKDSAHVLWTCVEDGHRKGVIIHRNAGLVEYMLLDSDELDVVRTGARTTVQLPGGALAPAGSRSAISLEDGTGSFSFFESPGSPENVAKELQQSLKGVGFETDGDKSEVMDQVNRTPGRVVVPFKGKDKKGFIIVAPSGTGSSRATVVVR